MQSPWAMCGFSILLFLEYINTKTISEFFSSEVLCHFTKEYFFTEGENSKL